jgi:hypothetical protein
MSLMQMATAVLLLSLSEAAGDQQVSAPITPAPELMSVLKTLDAGYRGFSGGERSSTSVASERIPKQLRLSVEESLRRIVRPCYIPNNLGSLLRGETRTMDYIPPADVDYLVVDFDLAGGRCSVSEGAGCLSLLWKYRSIAVGQDPGKTAALLASLLLQVPPEEAPKMAATVKEAGKGLFAGYLNIPIEPMPRELWENTPARNPYWHKQWYHTMTVWLADGYFYVSLPELAGRPLKEGEMRAKIGGDQVRFLPPRKPEDASTTH